MAPVNTLTILSLPPFPGMLTHSHRNNRHSGPETPGGALRQNRDHLGTRAGALPWLDPDLRVGTSVALNYPRPDR